MVDNQYFNGWQINGHKAPSYSQFPENQEVITKQNIYEPDLILKEFISNPKEYFDTFQEESCNTISERMDGNLIETDPGLFIDSYKEILKLICFCEEKELPLKTIIDTVTLDRPERGKIIHFLLAKGLIERTYKALRVLELDEQDVFLDILEKKSI